MGDRGSKMTEKPEKVVGPGFCEQSTINVPFVPIRFIAIVQLEGSLLGFLN
jgi:hypothetical protein